MDNLWMKLGGIMRFLAITIEGDTGAGAGGGADTGAGGGAGGGAGAGAGSTSSGATPTPPPSTAASQGAGAPAVTQTISSTLTDDTGKPVRELGEDQRDFMARFREYRSKNPMADEVIETPEQKIEREKAAATALAAKNAAVAETPEQKAEREKKVADAAKAAAETPEQKLERERTEKDAADRAAAAQLLGGDEYDLAPIPTESLAEAMKAHPAETLAFLKATGLTEDQLFANSRLAARAGEYVKAGLPTVEAAKHAVVRAKAFHQLDDSFTNLKAGDIPGTSKFLNDILLPLSYLRDENGAIRVDAESKMPLTDLSVFTFIDNIVDVRSDFQAKQIERAGSEQAIGSVMSSPGMSKILDQIVAVGKKLGGDRGDMLQAAALTLKQCGKGQSTNDQDLPAEVKARLAEADKATQDAKRVRQESAERERVAFEQKVESFKEGVLTESSKEIDKLIDTFLDGTSLKGEKFIRKTVQSEIRAALYDSMLADPMYMSQRNAITQGGVTQKAHKEWVSLNVGEAKARLRTVSEPIFAEAGVKKLTKAEERAKQIEGQKQGSQMEPKGGTSVALPAATAVLDKDQMMEKAREIIRARGEDPDPANLIVEYRKLKQQAATAA